MRSNSGRKGNMRRSSFRQNKPDRGKSEQNLEAIENTFALRLTEDAENDVLDKLRYFSEVESKGADGRLVIIRLHDPSMQGEALHHLLRLLEEGKVAFVTPVLRDKESQQTQILTDEITVRFTSAILPADLHFFEEQHNVTVDHQNEFVPTQYILKVPKPFGMETLEVASQLETADNVEFAIPNFISEYRR